MSDAKREIDRAILHLEHKVPGDPYVDGALECMRDARRESAAVEERLSTATDLLARMPFSMAVLPDSWSDWLQRRRAFLEGR
jgi:hypothetical protein